MLISRWYRPIIWILIAMLLLPTSAARAASHQQEAQSCPPYDPQLAGNKALIKQLPPECQKDYRRQAAPGQATASDIQALSVGGPDDFGYTFDDTVTESWIPGTTKSPLVGDDNSAFINIGFDFPFYGFNYSSMYYSTNGLLTFDGQYFWYGGDPIPLPGDPNNFIAPLWEDLLVGAGYNNGAIYYHRGGTQPNRYFVMEWRNVESYPSSSLFTFEVILHENGDIVFHHKSLPGDYYSTVGIENRFGDDGLLYQSGSWGLTPSNAIRFSYPAGTMPRVLLTPRAAGDFVVANEVKEFFLTVGNVGNLGTDTLDLTMSSAWDYELFAEDGITPLTDTDGDTVVDTGPLDAGTTVSIVAQFTAPPTVQTGDTNAAMLTAASSLDDSKTKIANLSLTIPAGFANVYMDQDDGDMRFMTADINGANTSWVTNDSRYGYNLAMERLANGQYFYAWSNSYFNGQTSVNDVEYAIVDRSGNVVRPAKKLTNNASATTYISDYSPAVAIAPNGTIGVVWTHYIYDYAANKYNYNMYMATVAPSGKLIKKINLTNNKLWGTFNVLNFPGFFNATIASTSDNRFVIGWRDERKVATSNWDDDIWYTVRSTTGAVVFPPTKFTTDGVNYEPVFSSLADNKVILTWSSFEDAGPFYAVFSSDGSVVKAITPIGDGSYDWSTDAVQLSNGKVAVAWAGANGIQFGILNSSYDLESGPTTALNPINISADFMSVTTDDANHVIMTWASDYDLFYALGDDTATVLTSPMLYARSIGIAASSNGQGSAPFKLASSTPPQVTSISRVEADMTNRTNVHYTVTFTEPVTGVNIGDFVLNTTDIKKAAITQVSGYAETHTVTVNTGIGNGTIQLNLVDNDSIKDEFGNPLGGVGAGNGDFAGETFTVVKGAPGVPVLLAPIDSALVGQLAPTMDWKDSVPAAHDYQIQVSTSKNFSTTVIDETDQLTSTYTPGSDLLPGTLYYWRVRAYNVIGGVSAWSSLGTFRTPLAPVSLLSPSDTSSLLVDRPTFEWAPADGANQYILQVSNMGDFSTLLVNVTVDEMEYSMTTDLPQNKTLFWRVRPKTPAVKGPWSATWSFLTGNPPSVPALVAPLDNALIKDYTPTFDWNNSKLPAGTTFKHYEIQWDEDPLFASPETNTTTPGDLTDSDFTPGSDLLSNQKYYWRVRAINILGLNEYTSGWSAVWSFRAAIPAPTGLTMIPNGQMPSFEWDDAAAPFTSYTIQISTAGNFSTFIVNSTTATSSYTMLKNLPKGKPIYWRVRVNGANGPSAWSTEEFTIP